MADQQGPPRSSLQEELNFQLSEAGGRMRSHVIRGKEGDIVVPDPSAVHANFVTGVAGTLPPLLAGVQCGWALVPSVEAVQAGRTWVTVRPAALAQTVAVAAPWTRTSELGDSKDAIV